MKTRSMWKVAIGFMLGTAAGVAFAQTTSATPATDAAFAKKAGAAGQAEIAIGNLAIRQSTNPSVKAFGQRMADDHQKAYDALVQTAQPKGLEVPSVPDAAQNRAASKLEQQTGAAFDRAFAHQMVKDHQDAVKLFTQEAKHGHDPDLVAYAKSTLPTLEDHLRMAKQLDTGPGAR